MADIILLGAPGAGKGTQAELLTEWLPYPQVSSGDLFRANISEGTELGQRAQRYMNRGELVPDDITIGMVAERIQEPDCAEGVIFDGFPRTLAQAKALDELLADMGRQVDLVLYIVVGGEVLLGRLAGRWTCKSCGAIYHKIFYPEKVAGICDVCGEALYQRADDTPETHRRRIDVYMEQTEPVVAYYQEQGVLVEIDGDRPVEDVQQSLKTHILDVAGVSE
jgi:adenylate kinase